MVNLETLADRVDVVCNVPRKPCALGYIRLIFYFFTFILFYISIFLIKAAYHYTKVGVPEMVHASQFENPLCTITWLHQGI
jgi:hypothetical protein